VHKSAWICNLELPCGRKRLIDSEPGTLRALVAPTSRGDPMSPAALDVQEHDAAGNAFDPAKEGNGHPDRNAQFEHISTLVQHFQRRAEPVISLDVKQKELVSQFKNGGREWRPKGEPE
jgi:hypothetical protein